MKTSQSQVRSLMLAPIAAATTARSANLDTKGADYATIQIVLGVEVNTNSTNVVVALQENDTTVTSNFVTFNSVYAFTADNEAGIVGALHVDLKGRKRYLRLTLTPDTTTNGAVICSAVGILDAEIKNVANSSNAGFVAVG